MNRIFAAAFAAGALFTGAAQAADIAPLQAHVTRFGSGTSALVYFTAARDGLHVVATTQNGSGEDARVARFVTVLANGQRSTVSVPVGVNAEPATLVFSRAGGKLRIEEPVQVASAH